MVLIVGQGEFASGWSGADDWIWRCKSGFEALELIRLIRVELLLVEMNIDDIGIWEFVKKARQRDSRIRWALLGYRINQDIEIKARSLGVIRIFHTEPDIKEVQELVEAIKHNANKSELCPLRIDKNG